MHNVHWDDLQFVHAVIEHGSLSAASRALGVNHATVLRRIALLEAAFEIKLFERRNDGYRLLPEGRALLVSLRQMDEASSRIMRNLALASKGIEGNFRLATTDSIACLLLPKYLEQLRATHAYISIEVVVSNNLIDMSSSGAEILLRPGHELPTDLSGLQSGTIKFGVFGAASYIEKIKSGDQPESVNWLGVPPHFAQSTAGEWLFSNLHKGAVYSADSFVALANMAARGLGLTLIPEFIGSQVEGLAAVQDLPPLPETSLWVATHTDFRNQSNIETLLSFFSNAIKTDGLIAN